MKIYFSEEGEPLNKQPAKKIIGQSIIKRGVWVVTIFLGARHGCLQPRCDCDMALFESKIKGGAMDGTIRRYHTKDEALKGHDIVVILAGLL